MSGQGKRERFRPISPPPPSPPPSRPTSPGSQPGHGRPHCTACSRPGLCAGPCGPMVPAPGALACAVEQAGGALAALQLREQVFPQSSSSRVSWGAAHTSECCRAAQQGRRLKGPGQTPLPLHLSLPGQQQLALSVRAHVLCPRALFTRVHPPLIPREPPQVGTVIITSYFSGEATAKWLR